MIYCLIGNSDLLKRLFISEHSGTKIVNPDDDNKINKLRSYISMSGMFGEDGPIVIKKLAKWKKDEKQQVIELLRKARDHNDFIVEGDLPKDFETKKFNFATPKPWDDRGWGQYIRNLATKLGISVDNNAAMFLAKAVGNDEMTIMNELQKLKNLQRTISVDDIRNYSYNVNENLDSFIFNIVTKKHNGLIEEFSKPGGFPLPLIISVIGKLLLEIGIVNELSNNNTGSFSWKEIDGLTKRISAEYPSLNKLKSPRVAKICGFTFSKGEKIPNLLSLYSQKDIHTFLIKLQAVDEESKSGIINSQVAFIRLLDIFS